MQIDAPSACCLPAGQSPFSCSLACRACHTGFAYLPPEPYFLQITLSFHIFFILLTAEIKNNGMRQIINHFTDDDLYKLTMCCAVIDNYPRAHVRYQFVDRDDMVYPDGFAREVEHQIELLESVVITDEEISFLRQKCYYLPEWFLTYLRGFRFSRDWVKVWQNDQGHLHVEFEGLWADTILL